MDLQQAITSFLSERESATQRLARLSLRYFSEWFTQTTGEALTLSNWTTQDTREYVSYLLHIKKLAPASINSYLSQLKAFAHWCLDEDLIARNPTKKVKGVAQQKKAVKALDRNEENALLRKLQQEKPEHRFIILFLMHTGLRASELVSLQLDDIELGEHHQPLSEFLSDIPKPESFRSGVVHIRSGKGMKARDVDLNATAREALLDYLHVRPKVEEQQLLISTKFREPLTYYGIHYVCRKYRTEFEGLHPHLLRKTFATKLVRTAPVHVAAELLGHANLNTTRRYLEISEGQRRQAVESIE